MTGPPLEVVVWGDFACFTRPEMKVERVSYPVPTPSAARGILEAIFWKPEFDWRIREIHILKPVRWTSLKRNEVSSRASLQGRPYIKVDDVRSQRASLALRDVKYLIKALPVLRKHSRNNETAYREQFKRRVARGECYHRPCLGTREFAAFFAEPNGNERPCTNEHGSVGRMLFDLVFDDKGNGEPIFFNATLDHGVLRVPDALYNQRDALSAGEAR